MKKIVPALLLTILVYTSGYALEGYTLYPEEGAYLTYFKKNNSFNNETTKYNYVYKILLDRNGGACRIGAIPADLEGKFSPTFFKCNILKSLENILVLSKDPVSSDPFQEFYFLYPSLKIGFMVIGKANDGFTSSLPNFPDASIAAIPLKLKIHKSKN